MGPDARRQFLGARHHAVAGLASAALDAACHGFDARTQQVLELRHPQIDVAGDRADPGFDALVDFLEPGRDGVGQLRAAAVDGLGDVGDAPVDGVDRLRGAFGQRGGEQSEARVERMDRLRCAIGQRRCQQTDAVVDGVGDRLGPDVEGLFQRADAGVDDIGDRLGARIEGLLQRADVAVDIFGDRLGPRIEGLFERAEAAVDGVVERLDLAVERGVEVDDLAVERSVEVGDAAAEIGLELQQPLVQRRGDLAAIGGQAGVEIVDIVLQGIGDILGALAHALDDFAAEGLHGAVEFRNMPGDQGAERAAVAGEFLRQFAALVLHQFVERAHLQRQRVVRGFGLADDLGHQRIHRDVERLAGLVAGGEDLVGEPIAGIVDLADEIAAAQLEFEQQRVRGILQGVVDLLGAVGNAVDDGGGTLFELVGDAVDALVQHLVDAVGEVDELVMDVPGLEVEAGGEAFGGVEHRTGGLGRGFLEPVEQVAAALAERQDHVVAGVAERAGDVGAALFQRAGDAFRDFIDARSDGIRDQRDVVAQIDLHAGDGAANLLGLSDQVVALMGDVLQQRTDSHLVVAVGTLQRGDFVGHQGFEFAGTRDRPFDAVAHGGDFAADRLADGDHGIGGGTLGLRKADRDLRHRLRDQAQFLAAPGQAGEEIDQQHRRNEQRGQAGQHQGAAGALADRVLQRGQEADGQKDGADNPDAGKQGGKRVDVAGRAAFLDRLQDLADGFAVIIGGAAARARLFDRLEHRPVVAACHGVEAGLVIGRARRNRRRQVAADRAARVVGGSRRH